MDQRSLPADRFKRLSAVAQLRLPIAEPVVDSQSLVDIATKFIEYAEQPTHSCYDYKDPE